MKPPDESAATSLKETSNPMFEFFRRQMSEPIIKLSEIEVGSLWITIEKEVNPFRDTRIKIIVRDKRDGWIQYSPVEQPGALLETTESRFRKMFEMVVS